MVLEKTLESPLDCKEIQPVHSERDHSWVFIGRTDAKAETPILWPTSSETDISGNFWGHIKGVKYRFALQDGTWDSLLHLSTEVKKK